VDATYDAGGNYLSGSILEYCIVEYAGSAAGTAAIYISNSNPSINNSEIHSGSEHGIYYNTSSVSSMEIRITNNNIQSNSGNGIEANIGSLSLLYIINNDSVYNGGVGVNCSGGASVVISIWNNRINYNGEGINCSGGASGTINLSSNEINNNTTGGVYVNNAADFTADDNFIESNTGNGIQISSISTFALINLNTIYDNNSGFYGGGIDINNSTAFEVTDNTITYNHAVWGGGLALRNSSGDIGENTITNNYTSTTGFGTLGGGLYLYSDAAETISIANNTISDNQTIFDFSNFCDGGGIHSELFAGSTLNITNNTITGNSTCVPGSGGGIHSVTSGVTLNIIKNLINNNISKSSGGGIYCSGGTIQENIIANNSSGFGAGIYGGTVSNNIVVNNIGGMSGVLYAGDISNNLISGNQATDTGAIRSCGNITSNSIINNSTTADGVFYLPNTCLPSSATMNNIYNNTAYDVYNDNSGAADLSNNWWGTVTESEIQDSIFDWYDDVSKGIVTYSPFLTEPNISAPISNPRNLQITANAMDSISIQWDSNPEADISGYIVYWDLDGFPYDNSLDVGNGTTHTILSLSEGVLYYIGVTAYDTTYNISNDDAQTIVNENQTNGNESWYTETSAVAHDPDLNFSAISGNTAEDGTQATFTLSLSSIPTGDVVIDVESTDLSEGSVSVSSLSYDSTNWNIAQVITVTGENDDLDDGDQIYSILFTINIAATTDTTGYASYSPVSVPVTNLDDDTVGFTKTPATATLTTSEDGSGNSFSLRLNSEPNGDVVIDVVSSDPTEGIVDTSVLIFSNLNWGTDQTVNITGVDDDIADGDQDYTIELTVNAGSTTDTSGYSSLDPPDIPVINYDFGETAGFMINPTSGLVTGEDGTKTSFTVKLTSEPLGDVTIPLFSLDETEGILDKVNLVFTSSDWDIEQTVTVTGVDDEDLDGDQNYTIYLDEATSLDPDYHGLFPGDVQITNIDNDTESTSGNNPPSAPTRVYPENNASGIPTEVQFKWKKSSDPDGDIVTYTLYYCQDETFVNCAGESVASISMQKIYYAGISLSGIALVVCLLSLLGNMERRRKLLLLIILVIMTSAMLITSCATTEEQDDSAGTVAHTVSGLDSGTKYYWKVAASDGNGGETESTVWSFTTE
jgi:hypothetical protein